MSAVIKLGVGLTLALVIGCNVSWGDGGEKCCSYETRTTGGTVTSLTGSVSLAYGDTRVAHDTSDLSREPNRIAIVADLPDSWAAPLDAGTNDGGEIGSARGWGRRGRVAVVELGDTPAAAGAPLVNAWLVSCLDPYETLVVSEAGKSYECESAVRRPARVEALTGTYDAVSSNVGVHGTSASGARVDLSSSSYEAPVSSYQACTRASISSC